MKLSTILAGADISVPSDHAIDRAAAIAARHGAKLVLVHVVAVGPSSDAPAEGADVVKQLGEVTAAMQLEITRRLTDKLEELRALGIAAEIETPHGPAGETMARVAHRHAAELIVVGTHGHTGISRFLLGSVATAILRHAPCDVLVCRGGANTLPFRRPLVAMDFSSAAKRALQHAGLLVEANAPIEVVHAWELPTGSWGASFFGVDRFPWSQIRDAVVDAAKRKGDKLVGEFASFGHPLHLELVAGAPTPVITHAAERGGHDLISLGAHGHGGFRRLLLGSVAEGVIRHAPCSVLVAHGAHGAHAGDPAKVEKM